MYILNSEVDVHPTLSVREGQVISVLGVKTISYL